MSRDEIIKQIVDNKLWYNSCLKLAKDSPYPNEMGEDLYQEFILIALEYDKEKLIDTFNNGLLEFWCYRVIHNMWKGTTSKFYYKYKRFYTIDVEEFLEVNHDDRTEEQVYNYNKLMDAFEKAYKKGKIEDLKLYEMMTRIYVDVGSFRAMEEELGVNFMTCKRYVDRFRDIVKTEYNSLLMDSNWDR